ncbi:MAG TPA: peptidase [Devosia sp.]|nr:peptidase [Devosia sp.]
MNSIALLYFPLFMALAATSDLLTMKISNRLVLALVAGFLVLALVINLPLQQFMMHIAAGLVVLAVAFSFFAFGWVGGGDAKLAAATSLWLGFGMTLPYLVYAALMGGALTLGLLLLRRYPLPGMLAKVAWVDRLHDKKTGIPYGIALAAAGLVTYADTTIFQLLIQ